MLQDDNLYNSVDPARRGYSLDAHYRGMVDNGFDKSPINQEMVRQTTDPKFALYKVVDHFIRHLPGFRFYDVGAWVGDVAIRYANYCRSTGHIVQFDCFDPTLAGDLIPYNVEINGLRSYVNYQPFAVSHVEGPVAFRQRPNHSDAGLSVFVNGERNTLVRSVSLSRVLLERLTPAIIKLDTENLEAVILYNCAPYLAKYPNAVCIEVNLQTPKIFDVLLDLSATHEFWDIGYAPKPFRATPISLVYSLIGSLQQMPYNTTDVLAISKSVPRFSELREDLAAIVDGPQSYSLTY